MAKISARSREELVRAVAERYRAAARTEKLLILDEFVKVTGYHRKHAIRALNRGDAESRARPHQQRPRLYDATVSEAVTVLWEATVVPLGGVVAATTTTCFAEGEIGGVLRCDSE